MRLREMKSAWMREITRRPLLVLAADVLVLVLGIVLVVGQGSIPGGLARPETGTVGTQSTGEAPSELPITDVGSGPVGGATGGGSKATSGGSKATSGAPPVAGGTKAPVEVGIMTSENGDTFLNSIGFSGTTGVNQEHAKVVIAAINAEGGLAGHPIVPVFADFDLANGQPFSAQMGTICATWTQDHKVIAGMLTGNIPPQDMASCLQKDGALFSSSDFYPSDDEVWESLPMMFNPGFNGSRMAKVYIDTLHSISFFTPGAKIGLVRFDLAPVQRVTDRILKPALAKFGLNLTDEVAIKSPESTQDIGQTSAQAQSAALRFSQNGITHVLLLIPGGYVFFFMSQSEAQGYNPKYGISSYDWATSWLKAQGAPETQLRNSIGVGWTPGVDLGDTRQPANPSWERCKKIDKDAGLGSINSPSSGSINPYCDYLFQLQAGATSAPSVTGAGLRVGIERLDKSHLSPLALGTSFRPRKHDGAYLARVLAYDRGCSCFVYSSESITVP